jgi:predicted HTH transcriptional regulator
VEYFLLGIARMSEDALRRSVRITSLLAGWRILLGGESSKPPQRLLALLACNPFVTTTGLAAELKIAYTTAQRAIDLLQHKGILFQIGEAKRGRVYCAKALLQILEEPAQLGGSSPATTR